MKKIFIKKIKDFTRLHGKYTFIDRSKNKKKLCIILCGYKEFLWDEVFFRLKKFKDDDIDFCILSSGIYSKRLNQIAKDLDWSYIYTRRNNVALIQNIAINLFQSAEYIFKLDEDIIICENYFSNLLKAYYKLKKEGHYHVGVVAPTLPVNGFCYINFLNKIGKLDEFESLFGRARYGSNSSDRIMVDPETAKYMWKQSYNIDILAAEFENDEFSVKPCHCRFSIGAILFTRRVWKDMGMFKVDFSTGLGNDEIQLCSYCMYSSQSFMISENTLAGHFCFGPQNQVMEKAYKENQMLNRLSI